MRTVGARVSVLANRTLISAVLALALGACTSTGLDQLVATGTSFNSSEIAVSDLGLLESVGNKSAHLPEEAASNSEALQTEPAKDKEVAEVVPEAPAEPSSPDAMQMAALEVDSDADTEQTGGIEIAKEEPEPKKRGFLAAFWSTRPQGDVPSISGGYRDRMNDNPSRIMQSAEKHQSEVTSAAKEVSLGVQTARASVSGEDLPGVRKDQLFEITRKSGLDDDSDVDVNEDSGSYQLASAAGIARLAPNGLLTQREDVDVACLKPALVRVLKTVERHYGRRVIVTSGYRSPEHNRRARGARNSLHMYCAATDIQVEGVSKWDLAKYLRSMPGRGGVGTYCHTNSVHVDVGPERDWNWRCRRRKSS